MFNLRQGLGLSCLDTPLSNQHTFHDYLDLARVAFDHEISQLREENDRLKQQIHSFVNCAPTRGLKEKVAKAGINGVSVAKPNQSVTRQPVHHASFAPATGDADQLLLDGLKKIILPEHEPIPSREADATPRSKEAAAYVRPAVPDDPAPLLAFIDNQQESQESLASSGMEGWGEEERYSNIFFSDALARWVKMCAVLVQLRDSESAIIHHSWVISLHGLSVLSTKAPPSSGHQLTQRILQDNGAHPSISCGVLSPENSFVVMWQCLGMLLCIYDAVMFPMQLVDLLFANDYIGALNLSIVIFWSVDIVISLQTGFHTNAGAKELGNFKILRRYARTWMSLDIIIVVFDWISFAVEDQSSVQGISRVIRFTRMVRVARLFKLGPQIMQLMGQLHSEVMLSVANIVSYLLAILILNHYTACVVFATFNWNGYGFSEGRRYLVSLHWAVAHSALGTMDIEPRSGFERLFSTLVMVLSMVIFSTFVSIITTASTRLSDLHGYRVKQEALMRRFFDENRISRDLSRRIWTFMWKNKHTGKQRLRTTDLECFALLPSNLLAEINVEMFLPILVKHPMFEFCSEQCPQAMVKLCMIAVEQVILRPSEELLWTMDAEVKSIYFIVDGEVLYMPVPDPPRYQLDVTLCKGMWACEAALWCKHAQVYGPFLGGAAGAVVMQVSARKFQEIMQTSTVCLTLFDYARLFIQKFNECGHDPCCVDALFNDPAMIQELVMAAKCKRFGAKRRRSWSGVRRIWSGVTRKSLRKSTPFRSVLSQISQSSDNSRSFRSAASHE